MRMRVIAIGGASGAGKTTLAGVLAMQLLSNGYTSKLDSFGGPIKERVRQKNDAALIDRDADRGMMQQMGTVMRCGNKNYYVNLLFVRNNMDAFMWEHFADKWQPADFLIIDDVRYENEAKFCLQHNGLLLYMEGTHSRLSADVAGHESEQHGEAVKALADRVIPFMEGYSAVMSVVDTMLRTGFVFQEKKEA